jgi:hypothetical protein
MVKPELGSPSRMAIERWSTVPAAIARLRHRQVRLMATPIPISIPITVQATKAIGQ